MGIIEGGFPRAEVERRCVVNDYQSVGWICKSGRLVKIVGPVGILIFGDFSRDQGEGRVFWWQCLTARQNQENQRNKMDWSTYQIQKPPNKW